MSSPSLHQAFTPLQGGAPLTEARTAIILAHGRGGDAEGMLNLGLSVADERVAFVALRATSQTWYPEPFMEPLSHNEPWLTSALQAVGDAIAMVVSAGIPHEQIMLLGFSQGACLTVEFAARNARRYGAVVALAGGLIGPDDTPRNYAGSLEQTPVFLGCGDHDPHIPVKRVEETNDVLMGLDGNVDARVYGGLGHVIIDDEVNAVRALVARLA